MAWIWGQRWLRQATKAAPMFGQNLGVLGPSSIRLGSLLAQLSLARYLLGRLSAVGVEPSSQVGSPLFRTVYGTRAGEKGMAGPQELSLGRDSGSQQHQRAQHTRKPAAPFVFWQS
jgi:hypothetical protein